MAQNWYDGMTNANQMQPDLLTSSDELIHSNREELKAATADINCERIDVDEQLINTANLPDAIPLTTTASPTPVSNNATSPSRETPLAYHLKWVKWRGKKTPIITQNENGPCPLIAIMNVLIFKGRIQLPPMMEIINANQLMEYLGDCILNSVPKVFISLVCLSGISLVD